MARIFRVFDFNSDMDWDSILGIRDSNTESRGTNPVIATDVDLRST